MKAITIRRPDDMHVHLRQRQMLIDVLPFTANVFSRAVVMGNLNSPVETAEDVERYRQEILKQTPFGFSPIMSIMLTKRTTPEIVRKAHQAGAKALKFIPANTSTHSKEGIRLEDLEKFYPVLETVRELDMIFSGHWELNKYPSNSLLKEIIPKIQQETASMAYLAEVIHDMPGLKIIVEHITTIGMIKLVQLAPPNVAATITAHHPILTTKDVLDTKGKVANPHNYCKPIAKAEYNRKAVVETMTSGNPKFFFGSDSASQPIWQKERKNPKPGIFSAPIALPLLCEIFEQEKMMYKLEDFVSRFGAKFYGLPLNSGPITLRREEWTVPNQYKNIKIFMGGKKLRWSVV